MRKHTQWQKCSLLICSKHSLWVQQDWEKGMGLSICSFLFQSQFKSVETKNGYYHTTVCFGDPGTCLVILHVPNMSMVQSHHYGSGNNR